MPTFGGMGSRALRRSSVRAGRRAHDGVPGQSWGCGRVVRCALPPGGRGIRSRLHGGRAGLTIVNATFASADTAMIATGRSFPDTLAATGAAGKADAPVILVDEPAAPSPAQHSAP